MKKIIAFVFVALICVSIPITAFCTDGDFAKDRRESISSEVTEAYYNEYSSANRKTSINFKAVLIAVGVGFIPAIITVSVMKGQLKSVKFQPTASQYVRSGSFELTGKSDRYLYSTVRKTERPDARKDR